MHCLLGKMGGQSLSFIQPSKFLEWLDEARVPGHAVEDGVGVGEEGGGRGELNHTPLVHHQHPRAVHH